MRETLWNFFCGFNGIAGDIQISLSAFSAEITARDYYFQTMPGRHAARRAFFGNG
ncbi:hypothetical protein Maes01_00777 [Microbulbifer aestuariivivens]|uniref:Uncharacterized protein n=1 Tax=Microbulbifer aestuariivivens TaxID=1908308 RepID=A0ABP9WLZ4_9GAMM